MMREHGAAGRHFAGQVNQIISGSIGFDDWEWGVDLFADDPLVFKKLIYEMRFDEASVWYAEFGPFWVGLQFSPSELPRWLEGEVPLLRAGAPSATVVEAELADGSEVTAVGCQPGDARPRPLRE